MTLKIFYNAKCSKAREALRLLQEADADLDVIHYLETPPTAEELRGILKALGLGARELLRPNEPAYESLGLADPTLDEGALITAMVENPRLIQRPIVMSGDRAIIGRPPEGVLELL